MIRLFFIVIMIGLNCQLGSSQDSTSKLGLIFPLEEKNDRVYLKQTCLINRNTILNKGTLLRVMFQLPRVEDADVKRAERKEKQKRAYSGDRELKSVVVSPQQEALKKRALATAWTNSLPFRALLNRTEFEEIYVVIEKGEDELEIESVDLPEGILLVENSQGVEVSWVANQQSGAAKEFRVGDRILAVNGEPIKNLRDFQQYYLSVKSSDPRKRALISVEVIGKGETRSSFLSLDAPPSLSGSLLDMP